MKAATENDLKRLEDLIINGQRAIETRLTTIENRLTTIETGQKTLELGQLDIKGDIRTLDAKIGGLSDRIKVLETSAGKTADLAEKVGELKNWRSIAFLILGAVAGWIARNSMINNP
jgi:hypothetical protein